MLGPKKVLFAGQCDGKLSALYKRVETVNASNGPFDLLICCGGFFSSAGSDDENYKGELLPYIVGEKKAPVPTYFIGGWGEGSKQALEALAAAPECGIRYLGRSGVANLNGLTVAFLDGQYNAAAYRSSAAAADGGAAAARAAGPGCRYHTEADVMGLQLEITRATGDVDVLLTNEWPEGLCDNLPDAAKPQGLDLAGSAIAADLALAARPRYHVAAGKPVFYARAPYVNADLGAGAHVTRFVGLAEVGNTGKQKWLHALAMTPAADMTPEQLQQVPQGSTPSPYDAGGKGRKRGPEGGPGEGGDEDDAELGAQTWRWQQRGKRPRAPVAKPSLGRKDIVKDKRKTIYVKNVPFRATEEDLIDFFSQCGTVVDVVRKTNAEGRLNAFAHIQFDTVEAMERACQLNGSQLMGRDLFIDAAASGAAAAAKLGKPVEGCWFCLSNPNADVELVASVGEECYVALDKGAITDEHVLVLPVEHYPSSLSLGSSTHEEVDRYLSALRTCYAAAGRELVGFERYMALRKSGGNHCHINAIAVPASAAAGAREVFEAGAKRHGFTLTHLPAARGEAARLALRNVVGDGEYFQALLPDGSRLVHPIAFGERFPLNYGREVLAELAGVPSRADWKACKLSQEEEQQRCERFKKAFAPYDIMS